MGKKVMILSASAGNGHVRAAQAIEEACVKDSRISDILKGTSKNYVLRNPISQKTRKSLHDKGIKVIYQIFQSASTDFFNQ